MYFLNILVSLISVVSLTKYAAASLRIKADHHSFAGVNYPGLQFLEQAERDEVIRALVRAHARVIRLFIRGDETHPDLEKELGIFDQSLLDQFDDTLAAIHRISNAGKVKVIIAPHDAHALRGSNNIPCDAYCKKVDSAFLDFYSNLEIREIYKHRLTHLFSDYKSKNFQGASWGTLKEVIMGVDLQNQPWSGIWPIVAGEPWLCDIATHLKETIGLGDNNIAVITGGISSPQSPTGTENFPDSAFDCKAVDVIGIHGYYSASNDATAGTAWANMFLPGNTLTSRALGKKLLLVEEMAYMNTDNGLVYKKSAIWDQGNALNYRGIPWMYSTASTEDEGTSSRVSILRAHNFAVGALASILQSAYRARSNFDWSPYLPPPASGLSNLTVLPLNPFVPEQSSCTFGCLGWLCDAADGCSPDLICKNSVCQKPAETQPGSVGANCNSKTVCQEHLVCEDGTCQKCVARPSIQPSDPRKHMVEGHITGQCHLDISSPFNMRPICTLCDPSKQTCRGSPCHRPGDCSADEFCDWGLCKPCTEGCLGMKCKSSNKCKTGYCNVYGRCDYPTKVKKPSGPGANAGRRGPGWNNKGPKDQQRGPAKVRDEAMRINIPKEGVRATGSPVS
ncbi:uncharacterized protein BDR25DRAFT_286871 [Lindgomyces ingoldianus]|uniref:Uncharacterized protein n=1 Tax=Lindgomyces ingoldianus TaxID=673940 RepID=A0ACB6QUN6_9PLEO|nr:uncharacterized protein BDR25DRAFT_286871 [Lindgomyces ingoldianus]KAF2470699.1 hypothetical protein BDR25DRAFT_286871 [Lindgomyces ingoldianus]